TLPLNLKIRRATRAGRIEAPLRDLPRPALASGPAARAEAHLTRGLPRPSPRARGSTEGRAANGSRTPCGLPRSCRKNPLSAKEPVMRFVIPELLVAGALLCTTAVTGLGA